MQAAALIFPNQLFAPHPAWRRDTPVYILEDPRFFSDFAFHKQKLVLHRASLKAYQDGLSRQGFRVRYLEHAQLTDPGFLFDHLKGEGLAEVSTLDPVDAVLAERLRQDAARAGLELTFLNNPGFICTPADINDYFREADRFHQTRFYQHQRRRLGILMEGGKPAGGRWTYDTANRQKLPKGVEVPPLPAPEDHNPYVGEAKRYVAAAFPDNPGNLEPFQYPVTRAGAEAWLRDFLVRRLSRFGDYEDAISAREPVLFHSVLSPLLNVGLLTPQEVLDATLAHAGRQTVPLNSLEGFVRQLLGWREYVRAVYSLAGERQRSGNFWGHRRALPAAFYTGETGLVPVDTVIRRVLKTDRHPPGGRSFPGIREGAVLRP
jgi:deoxyribodipyrimidine photolyase-related protein